MLPWKQAYKRWRSDLTLNIQLYVRFNWGASFVKFSRSYFTLRFSSCCRSYSVCLSTITPVKRICAGTSDPSTRFQSDNHPSGSQTQFVLRDLNTGTHQWCSRRLCRHSPLWSPWSWSLPCRWESRTGWPGSPTSRWPEAYWSPCR